MCQWQAQLAITKGAKKMNKVCNIGKTDHRHAALFQCNLPFKGSGDGREDGVKNGWVKMKAQLGHEKEVSGRTSRCVRVVRSGLFLGSAGLEMVDLIVMCYERTRVSYIQPGIRRSGGSDKYIRRSPPFLLSINNHLINIQYSMINLLSLQILSAAPLYIYFFYQ